MGSKDKKSKEEGKKKKKAEKEEQEEEEDEEEEDDDSQKKKKKKKAKKGSTDSDDEGKKGKGKKKKKTVDYVEIYENELRNYEPEKVENYEDEYYKKRGMDSVVVLVICALLFNIYLIFLALFILSIKIYLLIRYFLSLPTLAVYEVVTITGEVAGAGTDANIFVTLFGEYGITPKVHLASK